jgi:hypothetical protein
MFLGMPQPIMGKASLRVLDVFATSLYPGNSGAQRIINGIDLAGEGGAIWLKSRSNADNHLLHDFTRNAGSFPNLTNAEFNYGMVANPDGFSLSSASWNSAGQSFVSWNFRKAPKFFDIITYTGNGVSGRQIAHNLGVAPGMVVVKSRTAAYSWLVQHISVPATSYLLLNGTGAASNSPADIWNGVAATSTHFTLGSNINVNENGVQYVAYLFAHDPAADGVIQCGSYVGNTTVELGWSPQWLLIKVSNGSGNWFILDTARGWQAGTDFGLCPNTTAAELSADLGAPTSTGFTTANMGTATYIYLAIRAP